MVFDANEIEIDGVSSDAALVNWTQRNGKVSITLKREYPAGTSLEFRISYSGSPTHGVSWSSIGVSALYSSDHWMVCDMAPASLAKLELELIFPAGLQAAASGLRAGTRERNGLQYSRWRQDAAVAPFVFGFAVGKMQEATSSIGSTTLRFLSEKHSPEQMVKIFSSTQAAVRFFEGKSGVELGPVTYTQVLTAGNPRQELAQMTVLPVDYGDDLEKNPSHMHLLVHELAHQWWAVRVPCADWADFWLNEGMANFMANAFVEQQYGQEAYAKAVERDRQIYLDTKQEGKDRALYFSAWKKPEDASGPITYHKGAYVLHLLRRQIGDEAFWNGLREYTRGHVGKLATTQDLQHSMEQASGRSLRASSTNGCMEQQTDAYVR
jgi:aminopeptidase N